MITSKEDAMLNNNIESFLEEGERVGTAGDAEVGSVVRFLQDSEVPYCGGVIGHRDDGCVKVACMGKLLIFERSTPVLISSE